VRGGARSMRNSAIGCACLLAVFEGVGITMQRMFAQAPLVSSSLTRTNVAC
jgi:mitochondrial import inner membrane translocase subunit TIM17